MMMMIGSGTKWTRDNSANPFGSVKISCTTAKRNSQPWRTCEWIHVWCRFIDCRRQDVIDSTRVIIVLPSPVHSAAGALCSQGGATTLFL